MQKVYQHKEDGTTALVTKRPDGSFYLDVANKFDAEAKDAKELKEKLKRWGYSTKHVGVEKGHGGWWGESERHSEAAKKHDQMGTIAAKRAAAAAKQADTIVK